ncbi:DUF6339 family protein [Altererythrobacter rubellus]|uniref:DUF6339 family protein n=1 Tax=Altererythrobacter rubellus TaxID=2173831 RepID=A0A9Y2B7E5_9SPHN|nr:DUF6339 family protein [Altererythrobacter rubellus]WIW95463.1 DUF6339 family protein [Altererythrobacter rubellus]
MSKLKHVSANLLENLRSDIPSNIGRYQGEGFDEFANDPGWAIERDVEIDLDALAQLDGSERSATSDLKNSRIIMKALGNLTPSLANEEQIWVRLSHVEAFKYSRDRWLTGQPADKAEQNIRIHFFAPTQTGIRDDHALSRLWWNGFIAQHCMPENPDKALEMLLKTADIRSQLVERIWLMGRRKLAAGVFRGMDEHPDILASEDNFREFMKTLNMMGGGIVFEAMSPDRIDGFIEKCVERAGLDASVAA